MLIIYFIYFYHTYLKNMMKIHVFSFVQGIIQNISHGHSKSTIIIVFKFVLTTNLKHTFGHRKRGPP